MKATDPGTSWQRERETINNNNTASMMYPNSFSQTCCLSSSSSSSSLSLSLLPPFSITSCPTLLPIWQSGPIFFTAHALALAGRQTLSSNLFFKYIDKAWLLAINKAITLGVDEDEVYWRRKKGGEELEWPHNSTHLLSQLAQCFSE
ncbi:hypothetical protein Goari_006762 [Gossypium aridum]|uniref:Uncharacterized protein n=1 Tax=Gossypium aridum TaxID=34290 RepID=A0A7J8XNW0_GOSAI|nr:hypothetical protein [Gossypium aridum]